MTPRLMDRLVRLEGAAATPASGRHLVFKVEAPGMMPVGEIVAFLRERGHAIHDDDDVLVMNLGSCGMAEGEVPRDLSAEIFTKGLRAAAPAAGKWPKGLPAFTFTLESPGGAR